MGTESREGKKEESTSPGFYIYSAEVTDLFLKQNDYQFKDKHLKTALSPKDVAEGVAGALFLAFGALVTLHPEAAKAHTISITDSKENYLFEKGLNLIKDVHTKRKDFVLGGKNQIFSKPITSGKVLGSKAREDIEFESKPLAYPFFGPKTKAESMERPRKKIFIVSSQSPENVRDHGLTKGVYAFSRERAELCKQLFQEQKLSEQRDLDEVTSDLETLEKDILQLAEQVELDQLDKVIDELVDLAAETPLLDNLVDKEPAASKEEEEEEEYEPPTPAAP